MNFFQIVSLVSYSMILVFFEHYLLLMINDYFLTVIQTQLLVGSFQMLLKESRSNCILLRENSKSIFFFFDWPLLAQYWQILFHLLPNSMIQLCKFRTRFFKNLFLKNLLKTFFSTKKSQDDLFHLIKNYMKFLSAVNVNTYIYLYIIHTYMYIYIYKLNIYYYFYYYYIHKPSKTYKFGTERFLP